MARKLFAWVAEKTEETTHAEHESPPFDSALQKLLAEFNDQEVVLSALLNVGKDISETVSRLITGPKTLLDLLDKSSGGEIAVSRPQLFAAFTCAAHIRQTQMQIAVFHQQIERTQCEFRLVHDALEQRQQAWHKKRQAEVQLQEWRFGNRAAGGSEKSERLKTKNDADLSFKHATAEVESLASSATKFFAEELGQLLSNLCLCHASLFADTQGLATKFQELASVFGDAQGEGANSSAAKAIGRRDVHSNTMMSLSLSAVPRVGNCDSPARRPASQRGLTVPTYSVGSVSSASYSNVGRRGEDLAALIGVVAQNDRGMETHSIAEPSRVGMHGTIVARGLSQEGPTPSPSVCADALKTLPLVTSSDIARVPTPMDTLKTLPHVTSSDIARGPTPVEGLKTLPFHSP